MQFNEYQKKAMKTAIFPLDSEVIYPTLGLNGEAGEVAEKVKKVIRDKDGVFQRRDKHDIMLELGDCLWYLAAIADNLGITLEDVAVYNIAKLASRRQRKQLQGQGDHR